MKNKRTIDDNGITSSVVVEILGELGASLLDARSIHQTCYDDGAEKDDADEQETRAGVGDGDCKNKEGPGEKSVK